MSKEYSYPDPGDAITFKVIERLQSYESYWSDSEKKLEMQFRENVILGKINTIF